MNKNYNKPELEVEAFEIESDFAADSAVNPTIPTEQGIATLSSGLEFEINFNGNDEI